jgi:hypothetical protein
MPLFVGSGTFDNRSITPASGTLSIGSNLDISGWSRRGQANPLFRANGTIADWRYSTSSGWSGSSAWQLLDSRMGWTVTDRTSSFNTSNGRFTAPSAGYYHFMMNHYMLNDLAAPYNTGEGYAHPTFWRNGALSWNNGNSPYTIYMHGAAGGNNGGSSGYADGICLSAVMYLATSDYCDIRIYMHSSVTRIYPAFSAFWGWKIG